MSPWFKSNVNADGKADSERAVTARAGKVSLRDGSKGAASRSRNTDVNWPQSVKISIRAGLFRAVDAEYETGTRTPANSVEEKCEEAMRVGELAAAAKQLSWMNQKENPRESAEKGRMATVARSKSGASSCTADGPSRDRRRAARPIPAREHEIGSKMPFHQFFFDSVGGMIWKTNSPVSGSNLGHTPSSFVCLCL